MLVRWTPRSFVLSALFLVAACGNDGTSPPDDTGDPAAIVVVAGNAQSGTPGSALQTKPAVRVLDEDGAALPNVTVQFVVTAGGGVVMPASTRTDGDGVATTTWYLGPELGSAQQLRAGVSSSITTTFTATAVAPRADTTYFGRNNYIEYRTGTLPIIISAPHGGNLLPSEIPDRTSGETVTDIGTMQLAYAVADAFEQATGERPHLVVNRLSRRKLDANRDIDEAADGNAFAEQAWHEWIAFLETAREVVEADGGGLYLDLHGHGHANQRLELGYLLSGSQLGQSDASLNALAAQSSVRALVQRSGHPLSALLRGDAALGTLFENAGVPAVPSRQQPSPDGSPYFTGGYNTERFGSQNGGIVDGIQIESHYFGLRNTDAAMRTFANTIVAVVRQYFQAHYGRSLD